MERFYKTNNDFKAYVDRYVANKDISLEEVLSWKLTKIVGEYYRKLEEEERSKIWPI